MKKGDLNGAKADFTTAIDINPWSSDAYNNRGRICHMQNDLEAAVEDFNRALTLDPNSAVAYNNRGVVRKAKGDLKGALVDYAQAIAINPRYAAPYSNRAGVWQNQKDLNGALADSRPNASFAPMSFDDNFYSCGEAQAYETTTSNCEDDCTTGTIEGGTIDAGKSCNIRIVFFPLFPGERRSSILISYDDPGHPQKIPLKGNGINAGTGTQSSEYFSNSTKGKIKQSSAKRSSIEAR